MKTFPFTPSLLCSPLDYYVAICSRLVLLHSVLFTESPADRWWEARTVWGGVLNIARNIIREAASSWGFPPQEKALLDMLGRWVIAMPYLLKAHIRKVSAKEELDSLLPDKELNFLLASTDPCQRCAQVPEESERIDPSRHCFREKILPLAHRSKRILNGHATSYAMFCSESRGPFLQICTSIVGNAMPGPEFQQARTHIDEQIVLYVNYVGACERIYKTPIPIAFTVSFSMAQRPYRLEGFHAKSCVKLGTETGILIVQSNGL